MVVIASALAAFCSGIFLYAAFPSYGHSFLAWIALIPWLFVLVRSSPLTGFILSFLFSAVFFAAHFLWMFVLPGYSVLHHVILDVDFGLLTGILGTDDQFYRQAPQLRDGAFSGALFVGAVRVPSFQPLFSGSAVGAAGAHTVSSSGCNSAGIPHRCLWRQLSDCSRQCRSDWIITVVLRPVEREKRAGGCGTVHTRPIFIGGRCGRVAVIQPAVRIPRGKREISGERIKSL